MAENMTVPGPAKCVRTGLWLDLCGGLRKFAQHHATRGKGLVKIDTLDRSTHTAGIYVVTYREAANAMGVKLNYCPWCGVKIGKLPKERKVPR